MNVTLVLQTVFNLIATAIQYYFLGKATARLEEARRLEHEYDRTGDVRDEVIALLCDELDRRVSAPSRPSSSASPATAHDSRGESLRRGQNGELEWVDDETRGPMLKPASSLRGEERAYIRPARRKA